MPKFSEKNLKKLLKIPVMLNLTIFFASVIIKLCRLVLFFIIFPPPLLRSFKAVKVFFSREIKYQLYLLPLRSKLTIM